MWTAKKRMCKKERKKGKRLRITKKDWGRKRKRGLKKGETCLQWKTTCQLEQDDSYILIILGNHLHPGHTLILYCHRFSCFLHMSFSFFFLSKFLSNWLTLYGKCRTSDISFIYNTIIKKWWCYKSNVLFKH